MAGSRSLRYVRCRPQHIRRPLIAPMADGCGSKGGAVRKNRRDHTRQAWTEYRCYLSVLAGFSSHAFGGSRRRSHFATETRNGQAISAHPGELRVRIASKLSVLRTAGGVPTGGSADLFRAAWPGDKLAWLRFRRAVEHSRREKFASFLPRTRALSARFIFTAMRQNEVTHRPKLDTGSRVVIR